MTQGSLATTWRVSFRFGFEKEPHVCSTPQQAIDAIAEELGLPPDTSPGDLRGAASLNSHAITIEVVLAGSVTRLPVALGDVFDAAASHHAHLALEAALRELLASR